MPQPARDIFLHGAPGTVFDASDAGGKLVLVSADDGICAAVTNQAVGTAVATALEADLQRLDIRFRLVIDRDDTHDKAIHYREFLAARGKRAWRISLASVNDPQGGRAMLTGAPE